MSLFVVDTLVTAAVAASAVAVVVSLVAIVLGAGTKIIVVIVADLHILLVTCRDSIHITIYIHV